ncbi:MAG: SAM-dependent methyltransferase [Deltaproteobacteria bacterium HGW-Deltaproteobacteria-12]|nr:MAG: SAM-dependent methyltransferase [Deltaproteobacteria bacterium HGW-Deltaproteobacteria-12]
MTSTTARSSRPGGKNKRKLAHNNNVDPRFCGLRDAVRRGWYNLETGELFAGFKVTRDDIVLDVGCGEGNAILFCAKQGAHLVFSDVDEAKIKALIAKASSTAARKVEGFVSDSTPLPLADQYATKILATEMLEHTANPELILAELVRVGKPGAKYLITVPDARSEMLQKPVAHSDYFAAPNHIQIFSKERFVGLVESSGLQVEKYDTWGFYWTVFMSLFWIVHRKDHLKGSVLDNIRPPYHPVLQSWSNTWAGLMALDGAEKLLESFDQCLPKTQVIIARKD